MIFLKRLPKTFFYIWKYALDNWSATQADKYYSTLAEAVHPKLKLIWIFI